ncbi:MAG: DMT family transporter [Saezia sp.]
MISGTATGASWLFLYEAYVQIGVSMATLAYYCGPVIVMTLAPFIFHEKLTKFKLLGFMIVLVGMLLVNFQELHTGFSSGLLCGIMSAFMYAAMVIFNKKSINITGLENAMWQLIISFTVVAVFTFFQQGVHIDIPTGSILPILILGIVNTGIACYLYFSSFSQLPAQSVAICGYLDPVAALVFSTIFLHEHLTGLQLVGTVFILGGAALGELFRQKPHMLEKIQ